MRHASQPWTEQRRLDALLLGRGPLDSRQALSFLRSVAIALDELHARGLVHGDVRPTNIFVDEHGVASLASATDHQRDDVRYLAPERMTGQPATTCADVYALGLVAFEMVGGRPAYPTGQDVARTRARVVAGAPHLRDEIPHVPAAVSRVVARATALDPSERYRTAGELVRELATAIRASDPTEVLTRPARDAARRAGRRSASQLAAAALAALLLVAVFNVSGAFGRTRATAPASGTPFAVSPRTTVANAPASQSLTVPLAVRRTTPAVLGMSARDAARLLRDRGFRNDVEVIVDRSASGRAGTVVRQEPAAGALFELGKRARLFVVGPLDD